MKLARIDNGWADWRVRNDLDEQAAFNIMAIQPSTSFDGTVIDPVGGQRVPDPNNPTEADLPDNWAFILQTCTRQERKLLREATWDVVGIFTSATAAYGRGLDIIEKFGGETDARGLRGYFSDLLEYPHESNLVVRPSASGFLERYGFLEMLRVTIIGYTPSREVQDEEVVLVLNVTDYPVRERISFQVAGVYEHFGGAWGYCRDLCRDLCWNECEDLREAREKEQRIWIDDQGMGHCSYLETGAEEIWDHFFTKRVRIDPVPNEGEL